MARTRSRVRTTRTLATVLALTAISMGANGSVTFSGIAQAATAGPAVARPHTYQGHALTLRRSPGADILPAPQAAPPASGMHALADVMGTTPALPTSVDLSGDDEKVGDQGPLGSCAAWAIGYGMMGWLARSQGHAGAPYAPMYVYSQVDGGSDTGTTPAAVLNVLQTQGIDTSARYSQQHVASTFDYQHLPSPAEHASAAANKIAGWITLYNTYVAPGQSAVTALKRTLASGRPVALAIAVYQPFLDAAGPKGLITSTGKLGQLLGFHEVLVVGYDRIGIRIQNSWGAHWGDGGYATLDWNYVAQHSYEAETIAGLNATTNPARPEVTAVSPAAGPSAGGQIVTVTGRRLTSAIVSISANSVTPLLVSADGRRMTFRVPAGRIGLNALRVSTPSGVSVGGPLSYRYTR